MATNSPTQLCKISTILTNWSIIASSDEYDRTKSYMAQSAPPILVPVAVRIHVKSTNAVYWFAFDFDYKSPTTYIASKVISGFACVIAQTTVQCVLGTTKHGYFVFAFTRKEPTMSSILGGWLEWWSHIKEDVCAYGILKVYVGKLRSECERNLRPVDYMLYWQLYFRCYNRTPCKCSRSCRWAVLVYTYE